MVKGAGKDLVAPSLIHVSLPALSLPVPSLCACDLSWRRCCRRGHRRQQIVWRHRETFRRYILSRGERCRVFEGSGSYECMKGNFGTANCLWVCRCFERAIKIFAGSRRRTIDHQICLSRQIVIIKTRRLTLTGPFRFGV